MQKIIPTHMQTTSGLFAAAFLLAAGCSPVTAPEIVAQGIDDQGIHVILRRQSLTKPVNALVENGAIHIFVATAHPRAQPAICQTNEAQNTVKVLVHFGSLRKASGFHLFFDGKSMGDWKVP
jgi:hypothetical protein